jgi:competence protein ComGC
MFDMQKMQKTERCIANMKEVKLAVEQYMRDRDELFTGNTADLNRTGYLKTAFERCPEGAAGDKYTIKVEPETRTIFVFCNNTAEHPDHILE